MLFQLSFPEKKQLDALILAQEGKPFSYTKTEKGLRGYRHDENHILLGEGDAVFKAAKKAIKEWAMFPGGWARIYSNETPIEVGQVVVMCANVMGFWWLNTSRIVYTIDEPQRFGFAYGTLKHHAESGEELFQVRMDEHGQVFYEIQAFSRPRYWAARLAFPVARHFQRKFVVESLANMKKLTHEYL